MQELLYRGACACTRRPCPYPRTKLLLSLQQPILPRDALAVNFRAEDGTTSLHVAAQNLDDAAVECLLR